MSKKPKKARKLSARDKYDLWPRMTAIMRTIRCWKCEWCCHLYETGQREIAPRDYWGSTGGLNTHHYFGRTFWTTRYYFDNLVVLCYPHHMKFHAGDPDGKHEKWMKEKIGEGGYIKLAREAWRTDGKKRQLLDEAEVQIIEWEELIAQGPAAVKARLKEQAE